MMDRLKNLLKAIEYYFYFSFGFYGYGYFVLRKFRSSVEPMPIAA